MAEFFTAQALYEGQNEMTRPPLTVAAQLAALERMMTIRAFEEALARRPDHGFQLLSTGEEAVAVGLASALQAGDQLLTGGRSIGPALARGVDPRAVMAELLGRRTGLNAGKGGRGHLADPDAGFFGAHAVVGGNISIAAGVALALASAGDGNIAAVMFGDGACGAGAIHENLNIVALWRLPLLFVCNNNQMSVSTPRTAALAPERLSDLAGAYGVNACTIDGMDLEVVASTMAWAADAVRHGRPVFVECLSQRFGSHSTNARETRSPSEVEAMLALCPIERYASRLVERGLMDADARDELEARTNATIRAALAYADNSDFPPAEEALTDVW